MIGTHLQSELSQPLPIDLPLSARTLLIMHVPELTYIRNTLSLVSLSDERLNVKFKGTDGPDIVNVKK